MTPGHFINILLKGIRKKDVISGCHRLVNANLNRGKHPMRGGQLLHGEALEEDSIGPHMAVEWLAWWQLPGNYHHKENVPMLQLSH